METMTEPIVANVNPKPDDRDRIQTAPTCTCGKALTFDSETKSWKCFSCVPVDLDAQICATQKCKRPLTRLGEPWNCWRCLKCNPITDTQKVEKPKKEKYIDVTITDVMVREIIKEEIGSAKVISFDEDRVREIVQDELQNWHIQKPPATRDEIAEAVGVGGDTITTVGTPTSAGAAIKGACSDTLIIKTDEGFTQASIPTVEPKELNWRQQAKRLGIRTSQRMKVDVLAEIEKAEEIKDETV